MALKEQALTHSRMVRDIWCEIPPLGRALSDSVEDAHTPQPAASSHRLLKSWLLVSTVPVISERKHNNRVTISAEVLLLKTPQARSITLKM